MIKMRFSHGAMTCWKSTCVWNAVARTVYHPLNPIVISLIIIKAIHVIQEEKDGVGKISVDEVEAEVVDPIRMLVAEKWHGEWDSFSKASFLQLELSFPKNLNSDCLIYKSTFFYL
jgi:hypothetical protein